MRSRSTPHLAALVEASAAGDPAAYAELYDAVAPRVYGLALRILRDSHQSQEVTQEVLLEVWQLAERFEPTRASAMSWVLMLTHRRAVDRVRASEAGRRRELAHAEGSVETPYDETAAVVHASLEAEEVRAALNTLTSVQRAAIELAYFDGCTHTEVSRRLQIPLGTAKTRIRDGLIHLRDAMAGPVSNPA